MFAILIDPTNLPKILDRITPTEDKHPDFDIFINHKMDWYAITGYVDSHGRLLDWAILPEFLFGKVFEYDENVIKTDWDQIVRKD